MVCIGQPNMQIRHLTVIRRLTGVALGIGSTLIVQKLQEQQPTQPTQKQERPMPALTSPLLLRGEPLLGGVCRPF